MSLLSMDESEHPEASMRAKTSAPTGRPPGKQGGRQCAPGGPLPRSACAPFLLAFLSVCDARGPYRVWRSRGRPRSAMLNDSWSPSRTRGSLCDPRRPFSHRHLEERSPGEAHGAISTETFHTFEFNCRKSKYEFSINKMCSDF